MSKAWVYELSDKQYKEVLALVELGSDRAIDEWLDKILEEETEIFDGELAEGCFTGAPIKHEFDDYAIVYKGNISIYPLESNADGDKPIKIIDGACLVYFH